MLKYGITFDVLRVSKEE